MDSQDSSIYKEFNVEVLYISDSDSDSISLKRGILKFLNKKDNYADKPADGGLTAWLQVLACFFIFMNNFGLASAFGVYQAYYELVLLKEHSASSIAWIGTVQASLTLLVGVASGPLFDRGYFFVVVTGASIGLVFSFMMLSLCSVYWQIMLCQGVLAGICTGMLYIPSVAQIPQYFDKHLGLALGSVLAGAPVGGIVYPLVFKRLILSVGFGWATRAIGLFSLGLLLIAIILVKPLTLPNKPVKVFDPAMFRNVYYITFIIVAWLGFAGIMVPYFDCGTFWWNNFDHDLNSAFYTLLILNAGNFFGRFILTAITDSKYITRTIGPEGILVLSVGVMMVLGFSWIAVTTREAYYAWLVLTGFFSAPAACMPPLMLKFLAPSRGVFATCLGVVYASAGLGALVGVPIANAVQGQNYLGTQMFVGTIAAVALVFSFITAMGVRKNRLAGHKMID